METESLQYARYVTNSMPGYVVVTPGIRALMPGVMPMDFWESHFVIEDSSWLRSILFVQNTESDPITGIVDWWSTVVAIKEKSCMSNHWSATRISDSPKGTEIAKEWESTRLNAMTSLNFMTSDLQHYIFHHAVPIFCTIGVVPVRRRRCSTRWGWTRYLT